MKLNGCLRVIIAITILVCVLFLITAIVWRIFLSPGFAIRDSVIHGNHTEMLHACRQMISNYDEYTSDHDGPPTPLQAGEKRLSFWSYKDGATYETDPRLPEVIRHIKPSHALVGTNYIAIYLQPPSRSYLIADGGGAAKMLSNSFVKLTLLTNGLWIVP